MKTKRFERVCSITIHWSGKNKYTILTCDLMTHRLFIKIKKLQETTQFANIYNSKRFALKDHNSSQLYGRSTKASRLWHRWSVAQAEVDWESQRCFFPGLRFLSCSISNSEVFVGFVSSFWSSLHSISGRLGSWASLNAGWTRWCDGGFLRRVRFAVGALKRAGGKL